MSEAVTLDQITESGPPGEFEELLTDALRGRIVFMGVGNVLRGDDGIGPCLAERLAGFGLDAVDAGTVPENYIGKVSRLQPDTVVIIDAVHLDRDIGTLELLRRQDLLESTGFTTHTLSPALVMDRIRQETGAEVFLLAVQPACLDLGAPLSPKLEGLLDTVSERLASLCRMERTRPGKSSE